MAGDGHRTSYSNSSILPISDRNTRLSEPRPSPLIRAATGVPSGSGALLAAAGTEFHRVKDPQDQQDGTPPDAGVQLRVDHGRMRGRIPEFIQTRARDQNAI